MGIPAETTLFIGGIWEFFLNLHPALSALLFLAATLSITGIIYLVAVRKQLTVERGDTVIQEQQKVMEEMERRRRKLQAERAEILSRIPSGPVEEVDLPAATLQVRRRVERLRPDREFTIGRAHDNDLVISLPTVSRYHAKIRPEREGYVLYDLASHKGTLVNGRKSARTVLKNMDIITIGTENLTFRIEK